MAEKQPITNDNISNSVMEISALTIALYYALKGSCSSLAEIQMYLDNTNLQIMNLAVSEGME